MLKRIKLHSLKKYTAKNLEHRNVSERNTKLIHLGVLIDERFSDDFELLYNLGEEIGLHRNNVKIFSFVETRRKIPSLRQDQITNKEFNWRGEIQNQNAKEFLDFPFDVLLGIYADENKFLDAMIARSASKFKIGFKGADERLYDLIINIDPKDGELFKSKVKKYLKIFNKINLNSDV